MSANEKPLSESSIRARLLNIAKRERRDFNVVLNLFYQERLLARLAASRYRDHFLLKGGLLLFAIAAPTQLVFGRPTKDVDLGADGIGNDPDRLHAIFTEIVSVDLADGVVFDPIGITTGRITEDADYHGIRLRIPASLAGARSHVQVDVGFGDVVTPGPQETVFPALLEQIPAPVVAAYSVETVVAEKFEAMINLSLINSRMKDFFDLGWLARTKSFEGATLEEAIGNTFRRRGTIFRPNPVVFEPSFAADETRQRRWSTFLRQSRLSDAEGSFESVMEVVRAFLKPVHSACLVERPFPHTWSPTALRWE